MALIYSSGLKNHKFIIIIIIIIIIVCSVQDRFFFLVRRSIVLSIFSLVVTPTPCSMSRGFLRLSNPLNLSSMWPSNFRAEKMLVHGCHSLAVRLEIDLHPQSV